MYSVSFNEDTHVALLLNTSPESGEPVFSGLETNCPLCFRDIAKHTQIIGPGWKLYDRNFDNFVHVNCWNKLMAYAIAMEQEPGSKQTWYVIPRRVLSPKVIAWAEARIIQKRRMAAEDAERRKARRSQFALAFSK